MGFRFKNTDPCPDESLTLKTWQEQFTVTSRSDTELYFRRIEHITELIENYFSWEYGVQSQIVRWSAADRAREISKMISLRMKAAELHPSESWHTGDLSKVLNLAKKTGSWDQKNQDLLDEIVHDRSIFNSSDYRIDSEIAIIAVHLLSVVYSTDRVNEVLSLCLKGGLEGCRPAEIIDLVENWTEVQHLPISWGVSIASCNDSNT